MKKLKSFLVLFFLLVVPSITFGAPEDPSPKGEFGYQPISIEVDGAPLKEVLKIFSEQSGLSFIASQEVENKRVTVYLENVPAGDAMESILAANNLRYERKKSGIFVVYPNISTSLTAPGQGAAAGAAGPAMQTKIFHIKYSRLSISPMDVAGKNMIEDLPTKDSTGGQAAPSAPSEENPNKGSDKNSTEKTNLMAERGIDKIVASILSENGKVAVDISTNSLIVTDTAEKLLDVEKVISKIDVPPSQIMVEVQMMEVKKGLLEDIGVEWGGANGSLASFTGSARSLGFPLTTNAFTKTKGINISDPLAGTSSSGSGGGSGGSSGPIITPTLKLGVLSFADYQEILHFITSQTDTKILARPRVLTLNNEAANINLVTKTVVGTKNTLVTSQSLTTFTTGEAVTADTGITLKMTPQINDDQTISFFLQPSITTVAASDFFPTQFLEPTTRTVRTLVRVKDNEALVIGGLIDDNEIVTNKKIPLLGNLPLVGNAFNYKHKSRNDREFLIFITPHIIKKYDSLASENAKDINRDIAIDRMLDQFSDDEVNRTIGPIQTIEQSNIRGATSYRPPVDRSKVDNPFDHVVDKEMAHTLDSMNQQKPKA